MEDNWRALESAVPGYPVTIGYGGKDGEEEHGTIALVADRKHAALIAAAPTYDAIAREMASIRNSGRAIPVRLWQQLYNNIAKTSP